MTTATHAESLVPGNHLMAGLLGTRDELLRQIELAFPDEQISVQGNRISVDGPAADQVVRLFDELVLLLQAGQSLDPSILARTIDMVRDDIRPSEVLSAEVVRGGRRQDDPSQHGGPEALHRCHLAEHHHLRDRPGRDRQVLPGRGPGRARPPVAPGGAHHLDQAGRGGRGAPGLLAR